MRKIAIWIVAISGVTLAITMGVMGIAVYELDAELISTTAYIALHCLIPMFGGLVYLRWGSLKCPHCGKLRWINGQYCSYCGKKIEQ